MHCLGTTDAGLKIVPADKRWPVRSDRGTRPPRKISCFTRSRRKCDPHAVMQSVDDNCFARSEKRRVVPTSWRTAVPSASGPKGSWSRAVTDGRPTSSITAILARLRVREKGRGAKIHARRAQNFYEMNIAPPRRITTLDRAVSDVESKSAVPTWGTAVDVARSTLVSRFTL